jgi:AraC family transcriptional regulator
MDVPIPTLSILNRHCASERVVFGDVTYRPGGVCGPRTQADYQLVILEQGEATVEVDDETLHMPAQHMALMLPGRREFFRFDRNAITHHSWCAVRPDAVPTSLREKLAEARPVQARSVTPRMHSLIEFGLSLPASAEMTAANLIEHLGLAALYEYVFEIEASHDAQAQPEALRRAVEFIDGHLAEPLGLNEMAQAAYVTPQYLIRLFRQHLATTPSHYLWQMRVSRGVELLRETGLSIAEIAQRTGFKNPFHFSRLVKQQYRMSPRQLRKQAWDSDSQTV